MIFMPVQTCEKEVYPNSCAANADGKNVRGPAGDVKLELN